MTFLNKSESTYLGYVIQGEKWPIFLKLSTKKIAYKELKMKALFEVLGMQFLASFSMSIFS
jgi:hypothetical protein